MKKIIKIILIIICMLTIFLFSNERANKSTKTSNNVIITVVKIIDNNSSEKEQTKIINRYFVTVRKTAHFVIYLILGLLVINLAYEYNLKVKELLIISILFCMFYACTDEFHQLYIRGRSGEIKDVLLDTFGSIIGIFSYYLIKKKKNV